MASISRHPNGRWVARYRDDSGRQHKGHFERKVDAQRWLAEETTALVAGTWTEPQARRVTVDEWCARWLDGYGSRRSSTVRQARTHIAQIRQEFGSVQLSAVRPSAVRAWCARLKTEGYERSYVYALHTRLSQLMADAVLDGLIGANPCSRRTAPSSGDQVPYVATTDQVWSLHEAIGERYRVAVLLGAFAGLTTAETCGLRFDDVQWLKRELHPAVLYPSEPLKTAMRRTPVPIADTLVAALSEQVKTWPGDTIVTDESGSQIGPWKLQREFRRARANVEGLPEGFRYHDLRHYYASLLIASGADVKVVQHRLRHASAKTTLDVYGHLWPDTEQATRTAVERVMSSKINDRAPNLRPTGVIES